MKTSYALFPAMLVAIASAGAFVGCGSSDDTVAIGGDDGGADGPVNDASLHDGAALDGSNGADGTTQDAVATDGAGKGDTGTVGNGDGGDAGDGATTPSDGGVCGVFAATCSGNSDCCSKLCDPSTNKCVSSIGQCASAGSSCAVSTDCCTGTCTNGVCGANQCASIGVACGAGSDCCTGHCDAAKCAPISPSPTCTTAGNSCTTSASCCSGLCAADGRCALGSSYCIQNNDICYRGDDCCGGICSAPNGQSVSATNPGVCSQPTSGATNCTGVDGSLCPGGNCGLCCSRLCAPFGPTGVDICQPAQGCRIEGDLCRKDADCCGASGSGVLGAGLVQCSTSVNGGTVGVCLTPTASASADAGNTCVPEGDVCHYTASNYTCGTVSQSRSDCCGPQTPKFLACELDTLGVPRCLAYTGVPNDGGVGCRSAGTTCATAADCCNGNPCVPNGQGQFTCAATTCISSGSTCSSNADCCSGLPCILLPGSSSGTCGSSPTSPGSDAGTDGGGGTDGGPTPDGSAPRDAGTVCTLFGQQCDLITDPPCCTGTSCTDGLCL